MVSIAETFKNYPMQREIAGKLLSLGVRVSDGSFFLGPIELSDSKIARALGADRRAVVATAKAIESSDLKALFASIVPTADFSSAKALGLFVLRAKISSALKPVQIFSAIDVPIRQAILDNNPWAEPTLTLVSDKPFGDAVSKILTIPGVIEVSMK